MFDATDLNKELAKLHSVYADRLKIDPNIDRSMVSFQANRREPQFRWMKYREGFSKSLVEYLIKESSHQVTRLLDPFAGSGTALFTAAYQGIPSDGIELLPVGSTAFQARKAITESNPEKLSSSLKLLVNDKPWNGIQAQKPFQHLKITENAFSSATETSLAKFRAWLDEQDEILQHVLTLAVLGILESISFTRKDGQYLRWDKRSGRSRVGDFDKGKIDTFDNAMTNKLLQIIEDLSCLDETLFSETQKAKPLADMNLLKGDVFTEILKFPETHFDLVITSPPYLNRYDYTRTYALELAYLGIDEEQIRTLRQSLLTCTVENRPKQHKGLDEWTEKAVFNYARVPELEHLADYFEAQAEMGLLNNKGIATMIEGYFKDSALHLAQVASRMKRGGTYFMVNDNVRYNGVDIPVDLLLTRLAEEAGFACEEIKVLPLGKGNSSQQMGKYGKSEIRKCIYVWKKV